MDTQITWRIDFIHHDARLVGIATADRRKLAVEMVEPFPNRSDWRYFPHLRAALSDEVGYLQPNGELTDFARRTAECFLVQIFERETKVAELRAALGSREREIRELVLTATRELGRELAADVPIDDSTFYRLRQALRQDLRAGLDPHEYQRRLDELTNRGFGRELADDAPIDDSTFYRLRQALRQDLRAGLEPRVYQGRLVALTKRRHAWHHRHRLVLGRAVERVAARMGQEPSRELLLALLALDVDVPRCEQCVGEAGMPLLISRPTLLARRD